MTDSFNVQAQRTQFPALNFHIGGQQAIYFDGPGGTQVPQAVIDAMSGYLERGGSNLGMPFAASHHADAAIFDARSAMADLLNASRPDEIAFGQNMTSLTFSFSRALARTWQAGDEIILTHLDHDANITPWRLAAEERDVTIRWLDFDPADCTLRLEQLPSLLNDRTRLVAVTYASNAVGSISDLKLISSLAHAAGALVFVDAVHYAPHGLIDVQDVDCDILVCSAYKFFGPHTGVLYGKYELLDQLTAIKVVPAPAKPAGKWETGTQSFESLAGVTAAVDYIAQMGDGSEKRRQRLAAAMAAVRSYEQGLSEYFLRQAALLPALKIYGITDIENLANRVPTFALSIVGYSPAEAAAYLGERGIFVFHGHYYAVAVMERLGLMDSGGLVRAGFCHYNSREEVDRFLAVLKEMVAGQRR